MVSLINNVHYSIERQYCQCFIAFTEIFNSTISINHHIVAAWCELT